MKAALFVSIIASLSLAIGEIPLLKKSPTPPSQFTQNEQRMIELTKIRKNLKKLTFVNIDGALLSHSQIQVDFFDGEKSNFEINRVEKTNGDSTWAGRPTKPEPRSHDRFSLAKINGTYGGYFFLRGRIYEIIPLSRENSMLVERSANFHCGALDRETKKQGEPK